MVLKYTVKGIGIWLMCALFFLYEFLLRTVIGTFQHPIMYDLNLSAIEFSMLSSTFYLLIYAIMQVPVGLIVDRFGLKKSLFVGAFICASASIGFAYANTYIYAALFRFLTGFGSAFGFICLLVAVYDWLPQKNRALLIGISQFIGTMGPMIAAGPFEALAKSGDIDWRLLFTYLGIIGFVLSAAILSVVQNNKEKSGRYIVLKRPEGILKTIRHIFSKKQAWYIALFSALVYFSLEYLSENEGKSFLILKGISSLDASFMITISWLGYALGCPFLGWLSDFSQKRKPDLLIAALACSFGITGIVYADQINMLRASFLLLGLGASGQSVSFALMSEQFKKPYLAASLSLNNMAITTLTAINAPVISWALTNSAGSGSPTLIEYRFIFNGLIGFVCLSVIVTLYFLKETYCKSVSDFTYLSR